jgi:hypothetical protein
VAETTIKAEDGDWSDWHPRAAAAGREDASPRLLHEGAFSLFRREIHIFDAYSGFHMGVQDD